jgi:hypothetical protein
MKHKENIEDMTNAEWVAVRNEIEVLHRTCQCCAAALTPGETREAEHVSVQVDGDRLCWYCRQWAYDLRGTLAVSMTAREVVTRAAAMN